MRTMFLKMTSVILASAMTMLTFSGCMSDKEYQLRARQLQNQANHPSTFDVLTLEGPVEIEVKEGGIVKVTVPNQPFKEVKIPNGIKTQEQLIAHLIDVGAISVLGYKALQNSGTEKTTTIYNGVE